MYNIYIHISIKRNKKYREIQKEILERILERKWLLKVIGKKSRIKSGEKEKLFDKNKGLEE